MRWILLFVILIGEMTFASASVKVGDPAPPLIATTLDGKSIDLHSDLGKPTIVHFLATWCSACQKEMAILGEAYKKQHPNGLEIIGISVDRKHDRKDVVKLMQEYGIPIAMLDEVKVNDFGTPASLPKTFVVNRKGVVVRIFVDETELTESSLASALEAAAR